MPYEPEIPDIPSRVQELKMIEKIRENFIGQKLVDYNLAESDRIAKINLVQKFLSASLQKNLSLKSEIINIFQLKTHSETFFENTNFMLKNLGLLK